MMFQARTYMFFLRWNISLATKSQAWKKELKIFGGRKIRIPTVDG